MARLSNCCALVLLICTLAACDSSSADRRVLAPVGGSGSGSGSGGGGSGTGTTPPTTPVSNPGTGTPAVNSVPVALPDVATVQLNSSGSPVNVLANDVDANGDALRITAAGFTLSVPPTAGGSIVPAADGLTLRYTPPAGYVGVQTVSYTISDGQGGTASSTAVITVTPLAIPPVALADAFTLMTGAAPVQLDVLANDLDNAGGGLTLLSVASTLSVPPGNGGTVSITNNRVQYQPRAGFTGVDTLLYTLRDANGATTSATVLITVLPLAAPPVAIADVAIIAADTTVDLDVLGNDIDLAGGGLQLTSVTVTASAPPANGSFTVVSGRVRYTPPSASFFGTQTATYVITDSNGMTSMGLITLVVTPNIPPLPPVAFPDTALLSGGTTTALLDVLANDIDTAAGGLTVSAVSVAVTAPMDAGITASSTGSKVQLNVTAGYVGIITLSYTVRDANGSTSSAAVVVTVQPAALPPAPPVTVPDVFTTVQDSAAASIDVLANDVDPAGGGLALTAATVMTSAPTATHMVSVAGNQVRFAPAAGFVGAVTVSYGVVDANGSTATGTLAIVITAKPPTLPPVALPDTATVSSSAGIASIGVVANDIDTNGGGLTVSAASITLAVPTGAGTVAFSAGNVLYTPSAAYAGLVTVSYTVTDSVAQTASGTLVITVAP
ncbi:MAG: Ig-like domain-containing protein [Pseudomonadota bacterium]